MHKYCLIFPVKQYSNCYCGKAFGKYGSVVDSQCNLECPGNSSQNCGAPWRNSVYAGKLKCPFVTND